VWWFSQLLARGCIWAARRDLKQRWLRAALTRQAALPDLGTTKEAEPTERNRQKWKGRLAEETALMLMGLRLEDAGRLGILGVELGDLDFLREA
jgi:hypothetical protein